MNKKKIVLGHPYSGAFYWLSGRENPSSFYKGKDIYDGSHAYYKTLYGKNPNKYFNDLISILLLFDEIFIIGADEYIPTSSNLVSNENIDKDIDLNLNYCWEDGKTIFHADDEMVSKILNDKGVGKILKNVPSYPKVRIINNIIAENRIAIKYDAQILCNDSHKYISKIVIKELLEYSDDRIDYTKLDSYLNALNDQFNIFGIQYSIDDFWDFVELKKNMHIRKYANSFNEQINRITSGKKYNKTALYRDFLNLYYKLEKRQTTNKVLGITGTAAGFLSFLGLIPNPLTVGIGIGASTVGLSADLINRIANKKWEWIMFAPKVNEALTIKKIESYLNNSEKNTL